MAMLYGKVKDKHQFAVVPGADHDRRSGALERTDVALPLLDPEEGLKCRAIRLALERAPVVGDFL